MKQLAFKSVFSEEINNYLEHKKANGYKEKSFCHILHKFNNFIIQHNIKTLTFTKDDADI